MHMGGSEDWSCRPRYEGDGRCKGGWAFPGGRQQEVQASEIRCCELRVAPIALPHRITIASKSKVSFGHHRSESSATPGKASQLARVCVWREQDGEALSAVAAMVVEKGLGFGERTLLVGSPFWHALDVLAASRSHHGRHVE